MAPNEGAAKRAEAAVFDEIARLARALSTWDADGELAKLIASGSGRPGPTVTTVLHLAEGWRKRSRGAFEPGIAVVTAVWAAAVTKGTPPTAAELATACIAAQSAGWTWSGDSVALRGPISLDAIAKGWIVERASAKVATVPGVTLQSLQIGGDTRFGPIASEVQLVDPRHPASNGTPLRTLAVRNLALGSSGSHARGFDIGDVHHSHILDPRSGQPCDNVLGAYVLAPDAADADVLATVLCVLGPKEGLELLATVPGTHAILVTADGKEHSSAGFAAHVVGTAAAAATAATDDRNAWPADWGLQIDFEIKGPAAAAAGGRGRGGWKRPYVAVWIEDLTGAPARTLCLWIENRRWLPDLRRWSRQHAELPEVERLVAQATRKAGAYTLVWDGKDDEGRRLHPGRYTVCIEISREHGTYQLMKHEVELVRTAVAHTFPDNTEASNAKLTFGKRARSAAK